MLRSLSHASLTMGTIGHGRHAGDTKINPRDSAYLRPIVGNYDLLAFRYACDIVAHRQRVQR